MPKTLVIRDAHADFEARSLAWQLFHGGRANERQLFVLPPTGATPMAIRRIARLDREFHFDAIHAIGPSALTAAAIIGCTPIVYSPPGSDPLRGMGRLRWVSAFRQVVVACDNPAVRRELVRAGLPPGATRVIAQDIGAAPPPSIRRADLGLSPVDRVIIAPGDSTRRAGHRLAVWTVSVLNYLDSRYRLLIAGAGSEVDRLRWLADAMDRPGYFVIASDFSFNVNALALPALADAALFTPAQPMSSLSARVCAHHGLPIVSSSRLSDVGGEIIYAEPRARVLAEKIHARFETGMNRQARVSGFTDTTADERWDQLYEDAIVGRRASL